MKTRTPKKKSPTTTIVVADPSDSHPEAPRPDHSGPDWTSAIFAVGHQPAVEWTESQRQLFQSFQSNLVSLLSHELRTPLMSILNALSALDEQGAPLGSMSMPEALEMARKNARKLEGALSTVLDLAAWEAGVLQVHVGESSLDQCIRQSTLARLSPEARQPGREAPILADPAKLSRALSRLQDFAESCGTGLRLETRPDHLILESTLNTQALSEQDWQTLWHEVLVAREAGGSLPLHVFAGVLQNERDFLSRSREGLGAELHLVAEVLRQHEASFEAGIHRTPQGSILRFEMQFPKIEGPRPIARVLQSRIWRPGATAPGHVRIRAHARPVEGAFAVVPGKGPWVEILDGTGSASRTDPGQAAELRCPEHGHDAEALLAEVLSQLSRVTSDTD